LDTHAAMWAMQGNVSGFSQPAQRALELDDEVLISPMVVLELETLHEIGRLKVSPREMVERARAETGLRVCNYPFDLIIQYALEEKWTRDPFDRIIVAHARARGAPLVTKDADIRRHYERAVW
jgi:PIN domain nuclease of toxin-antitoxin system